MVFGADMKGFNRAMTKAQKATKRLGNKMKKTGRSMSRNLTMPLLAIGAASAKLSMDFDKSMTKITTLVGIADSEVQKMKKSVLDLSDKTGMGPEKLAEGLYFLTSAGLRGANALETLEQVAKGAAAGLGELEDLARVAAAAQNAYGESVLSASDALDIFGGIVQTGMFKAEELSAVLGTQLGLASSLGISFEEVGAFIATYTKTTGDANAATTGLSGVMMSFAKITPKQEKALAKVGMTTDGLRESLSKKGLQGTLMEMQQAFAKNGVELSEFFSKSQSLKGVLGILGNQTDSYIEILDELGRKQNFIDKAFERTSQGSGFQMTQAFNSLKVAGTELGDTLTPIIKMIAAKIQSLARFFRSLTEDQRKSVVMWAGIVAAVGPLILLFGSLMVGVVKLKIAMASLSVWMSANPYVLMTASLVLMAAAITKVVFAGNKLSATQKMLNDISNDAIWQVKEQTDAIKMSLKVARDSKRSDEERKTAVKYLNREVGALNGTLKLSEINTNAVTTAVDNHTESLVKQAQMAGAIEKMAELNKELFDLEQFIPDPSLGDEAMAKFGNFMMWLQGYGDTFTNDTGADFEIFLNRQEISDVAEKIRVLNKYMTDLDVDISKHTKTLKMHHVENTTYANSLQGMQKKLSDLNQVFKNATKGSDDYNKSVKMIKDLSKEIAKEYEKLNNETSDLLDNEESLTLQLAKHEAELKKLIKTGGTTLEYEEAVKNINDTQEKLNKNTEEYNRLLGITKQTDPFKELKDNVNQANKELKEAIIAEEGVEQAASKYAKALDSLNEKQDEYNNLTQESQEKTNAWADLLDKLVPDLEVFGESLGDLFREFGASLKMVLDLAVGAIEAFNNKEKIIVENNKKRKEKLLDEELKEQKERIATSQMSEEQKERATEQLEKTMSDKRVALEEETEAKLNKIKRRQAILDKAMAITNIIMNTAQAVMKVWGQSGIFGGPVAAAIVGAIGAAQIALVASTPIPLAEGGIISGPTQALMGEYPSAGSGNPEVVAPLNKLKSMLGIGSGNSNITVTGRLRGNDIYLSNANAATNRLRTS